MEKINDAMKAMGVYPKLRLGEKLKGGGMKSFGPIKVKFLAEPDTVMKKFAGKKQKALRFTVESEGTKFYWYVKILDDEGALNYLVEILRTVKVGEERVLEMSKQGMINYIDVRAVGAPARAADEDEGENVIEYGEEEGGQGTLA